MLNRREQTGFSLFEVLVAMSMGILLFVLLLSIYSLSVRTLATIETHGELAQNARIMTNRLSREIRQAKQIATVMPITADDPLNPPASEIEIQDGHGAANIQYIRYYLSGTDLKRQLRRYYFQSEPETFVIFNSRDSFGNSPQLTIVSDELVGQFVQSLKFYGLDLINIVVDLKKFDTIYNIKTAVYGRNF